MGGWKQGEPSMTRIARRALILTGAVVAIAGTLVTAPPATAAGDRSPVSKKTPADESRAGGPIVGDPGLLPSEQACVASDPNPPWLQTLAPFEIHDSQRTHLYGCAHFTGTTKSDANTVFAHSSPQSYPTPYNLIDAGPNELFVYGGGYGDGPSATGSFVARVQPGSLDQTWRTVLINTNVTGEWNYPGVVNVLSDGTLVVIFGYHIAKLDPNTGAVLAEATLPTGGSSPANTSYNGYDALPDGTIIAKSVNRQPGCTEQGFSAFLQCPDPSKVAPSVMVAINPTTLQVEGQTTLPEMIGGRLTTTEYDGEGVVYLPGATKLYRYVYADGRFTPDSSWGPVPYLKPGQTAASAVAVINGYVVGMTNGGGPTETPMSTFAVSEADSSQVESVQPFADGGSKYSFIPSMVSVDPANNRVYVMDAGAGEMGALNLVEGKLSVAWTKQQRTLSFTTLIGPADQRVLVGTNIPVKYFKQLKNYSSEQVVWRNAATGAVLATSSKFPKMTPGVLVTPGYAGLQYFLSYSGHIIALQVNPSS